MIISTFKIIKFKSDSCGLCHRMSHYDAKTADIMGFQFEVVDVDNPGEQGHLIKYLIQLTPRKKDVAFPAYVILKDEKFTDGWQGAVPKHIFKTRLENYYAKHGQQGSVVPSPFTEDGASLI